MSLIATITQAIAGHYYLFSWTDAVEITLISCGIYGISHWLAQDAQHRLLFYFYTYVIAQLIAYALPLPTISFLLIMSMPIAATLFIIMHQHQLQRNFITCARINPELQQREQWVETLIQAALTSINNNRTLYCIIEHRLSLEPFVQAPFLLNARFDKQLLNILMDNPTFTSERMLWLNTDGQIVAINATWRAEPDKLWLSQAAHDLPVWQQNALFYTKKTDAIIIRITPEQRTFDVILKGALVDNINAHTTMKLIKEAIKPNPSEKELIKSYEKISAGKQANS